MGIWLLDCPERINIATSGTPSVQSPAPLYMKVLTVGQHKKCPEECNGEMEHSDALNSQIKNGFSMLGKDSHLD